MVLSYNRILWATIKTNNTFLLVCRDDPNIVLTAKLKAKYDYIPGREIYYTDKRPGKRNCKILTSAFLKKSR